MPMTYPDRVRAGLRAVTVLFLALASCNSLTGASDERQFVDAGGASQSGGAGAGAGSGAAAGSGQAGGVAGAGSPGVGAGGTAQGAGAGGTDQGGTSQGGTGQGGSVGVCNSDGDTPTCDSCITGACCSGASACTTDSPCWKFFDCVLHDSTTSGVHKCQAQFPSGVDAAIDFIDCVDSKCVPSGQCFSLSAPRQTIETNRQ